MGGIVPSDVAAYGLVADGGERLRFGEVEIVVKASAETTAGAFSAFEEIDPVDTPLHVHQNEHELFCVLEGDHVVQVGDQEFRVGPGGLVFAPRGIPQNREAALAQPGPRAKSPLLVGRVGQQLAAVGGVVAALEALDVGGHLGGRGELDDATAKYDRGAITERAARVARGLVQVGRGGIGAELRPEQLEHLVARHPVAASEREQLHEIGRAPLHPGVGRDGLQVDEHFKASEQSDLKLPHTSPTIPPGLRSTP